VNFTLFILGEIRRLPMKYDQQVSGLKKPRLCRFAPGENYACSAGFFLGFTGSVKQAPEHNMFFTTYYLHDILKECEVGS
jgi:hypothetical protein